MYNYNYNSIDPFHANYSVMDPYITMFNPYELRYKPCQCGYGFQHPTYAHTTFDNHYVANKDDQIGTLKLAQRFYGKEACVFVGNLDKDMDDVVLSDLVQEAFNAFGPCYVAVFRGHWSKPYAIVQYTKEQDAVHAEACGQGLTLASDRQVRVERSDRADRDEPFERV